LRPVSWKRTLCPTKLALSTDFVAADDYSKSRAASSKSPRDSVSVRPFGAHGVIQPGSPQARGDYRELRAYGLVELGAADALLGVGSNQRPLGVK
jgi:hypothetical protein